MKKKNIPIRILQVLGFMDSGGVESCVMNYYRNIDRDKFQFDFIACEGSSIPQREEIESLGGKIYVVSKYTSVFKYIKEVREIIKNNKYEIVHAEMNSMSIFPLYAAYREKVKIRIAHSHSTSNKREWKRNILKGVLRPFSRVFATDYFACSIHAGKWLFGKKEAKNDNIFIMSNAIDNHNFKFNQEVRDKIRKELKIESKYVIGHVGRFVTSKNHEFLIDVFKNVHDLDNNVVLMLLGDGELEESLRKKVNDLGLDDCVLFLGVKNNVYDYMQAMDIFVFPSLYEGLGMVAIEAQSNELFTLCSKGVPEEARISNKICFYDLKNKKPWINKIIKEKENRNQKTIFNNQFNKYDIKIQSKVLENKYEELLNKKNKE